MVPSNSAAFTYPSPVQVHYMGREIRSSSGLASWEYSSDPVSIGLCSEHCSFCPHCYTKTSRSLLCPSSFCLSTSLLAYNASCSGWIMVPPKGSHILISEICECYFLYFADVIKNFTMGGLSGFIWVGPKCNHKSKYIKG